VSDAIVIVDYDLRWPSELIRLRDRAQAVLGDVALAIEHVGSTPVPGLPAKDLNDRDYVALERELAARHRDDRLAHTDGKTQFNEATLRSG
jgi:GrpB-like predicted nucleotidyltransferase (UPF0157 family)